MITDENLQLLVSGLAEKEAYLILSPSNRFYLTGFEASDGFAFITRDCLLFYTDSRYVEAAKQSVRGFEVRLLSGNTFETVKELMLEHAKAEISVEAEYLTVSAFSRLSKRLGEMQVRYTGKLDRELRGMRSVKTEEEISFIAAAAEISQKAFEMTLPSIKAGVSERDIKAKLEYNMAICGGDGLAFETIAAGGANSSKPHAVAGDYILKNGDFLTLDFGAKYRGYCSDMTRTLSIGKPTDQMREVYETVLTAQIDSLGALASGKCYSEVDAAARTYLDERYRGCFGHGLGHSVGIDIHESPALSPACSETMRANTIMTVEPGIYLEGQFGVRIEDIVVITETGCKNLVHLPKELVIL